MACKKRQGMNGFSAKIFRDSVSEEGGFTNPMDLEIISQRSGRRLGDFFVSPGGESSGSENDSEANDSGWK
jgi:hypothetical protein